MDFTKRKILTYKNSIRENIDFEDFAEKLISFYLSSINILLKFLVSCINIEFKYFLFLCWERDEIINISMVLKKYYNITAHVMSNKKNSFKRKTSINQWEKFMYACKFIHVGFGNNKNYIDWCYERALLKHELFSIAGCGKNC